MWVLALLLATWTARFVLRLALKLLTPHLPRGSAQERDAGPRGRPRPRVEGGARFARGRSRGGKAARNVGAGVGKGAVNLSVKGIKGAGAIGARVGAKGIRGVHRRGQSRGGHRRRWREGRHGGRRRGGEGTLFGIVGATRAGWAPGLRRRGSGSRARCWRQDCGVRARVRVAHDRADQVFRQGW